MRHPITVAAVAGLAMIALGAAVYAALSSLDLEDYAMMCTSGLGCVSRDPFLFTLHGGGLLLVQPLFTAGAVIASSALALAALSPWWSARTAGTTPSQTRRPRMRSTIVLWCVAVALVVGGSAYGAWSKTPDVVNSTIQECTPGVGCSQTVVYTLQQLSIDVVPAAVTAGLLLLGLAIVVTALRRRAQEATPSEGRHDDSAAPVEEVRGTAWHGSDLTPFMRPSDDRR